MFSVILISDQCATGRAQHPRFSERHLLKAPLRRGIKKKKRLGTVWHDNESICIVPKRTVLHSGRCRGVVCCIVRPWKHLISFSGNFLQNFVSLETSYDLMMRSCCFSGNALRARPPFFGPIIRLPRFTRLMLCDRCWKHCKANQSITKLYLGGNEIGDDGANALAGALKEAFV